MGYRLSDLYNEDFVRWTQQQAALLREQGGSIRGLDAARLAEEVEDLGKAEINTCVSLAGLILQHFYYLNWVREERPKGHWRSEIQVYRFTINRSLTPTIRAQIEAELGDLHALAAEAARQHFQTRDPEAPTPSDMRWSLAEILGETAKDPAAA